MRVTALVALACVMLLACDEDDGKNRMDARASGSFDEGAGGVADGDPSAQLGECGDWTGGYEVWLDPSSSEDCGDWVDADAMCTVSQDGCDIRFVCDGAPVFTECSLDSDDGCAFLASVDGMGVACTLDFGIAADGQDSFEYECSVPQWGVVCTGQAWH